MAASLTNRNRVAELLRCSQRPLSREEIVHLLGMHPAVVWSALVDLQAATPRQARIAGRLPTGKPGALSHLYDKHGHLPDEPRPASKTPAQRERARLARMRENEPERYHAYIAKIAANRAKREQRKRAERRERLAVEGRALRKMPTTPVAITPAVRESLTLAQQYVIGALELLAPRGPVDMTTVAARAGVPGRTAFYALKELLAAEPPLCRVADYRPPRRGRTHAALYDLRADLPPAHNPNRKYGDSSYGQVDRAAAGAHVSFPAAPAR